MNKRLVAAVKATYEILRSTWLQMRSADVQVLASSLAFATVISFVPLLAVSLSVFNAYGGFESLINKIEPFIMQNFVEASGAQASRYIRRVVTRIHSGALGVGGVIGLLFASTKLFHDMETAVHRVWGVPAERSFIVRLIVYWLIMFVGPLLLAATLGLIGSRDLGLFDLIPKATIAFVFTLVGLFAIYKLVPAVKVRWQSALIGAFTTTVGIALAQGFYATIMRKFFSYGKMYGSFASIPVFLIWLLVLWWICLAGVALTAVLEKRSRRAPSATKTCAPIDAQI